MAGGCASTQCPDSDDKSKCTAPKEGTITSVNTMCAVNHNDPVDPAVATAEWKGQKIGFCCAGCVPKWNKMTPAQKDAAVAAVTKAN
jgi:hypothetical protein